MNAPYHQQLVTLPPLDAAQLDPPIDPATTPDPDNPAIARTATGQQVALTPARMADFLESLQTLGNVSIACQRAGVARQTAYRARRRSPGFARAWDAALVAARTVAETELAERALNGVEEAVYYHGEEIARRRRYDSRLLLAHLARLDKAAERLDVAATMPLLDDQIEGLRALGDGSDDADEAEVLPAKIGRGALRQAQDEREWVEDPAGKAQREEERELVRQAREHMRDGGFGISLQDTVTPVTPCRDDRGPVDPCPDCGGFCRDAESDECVALTQADCMWFGNRLDRMEAARSEADEPSRAA